MTAVPVFDREILVVVSPDDHTHVPSTRIELAMIMIGSVLVLIALVAGIVVL